jgi:hypothetical protein
MCIKSGLNSERNKQMRTLQTVTRKDAVSITRRLWTWLSEKPGRFKHQWPEWAQNDGDVPHCENMCGCCEYVHRLFFDVLSEKEKDRIQNEDPYSFCITYCPLVWPDGSCETSNRDGLYQLWANAIDTPARMVIARQIAELPEREARDDED